MSHEFGIATRFYGLADDDKRRLETWVEAALKIVSPQNIYVAIRTEADLSGSLNFMKEKYPEVISFPVTPWGKVVQAPNALLLKCAEKGTTRLMFVSTEYLVTKSLVLLLESHLDPQTLVVGACLSGHVFEALPGEEIIVDKASGLQIPWNTCALWSIAHLVHTGFVLAADSLQDPNNAGMEEMGTIAAQQILWPNQASAKLVALNIGDLTLNTFGWNVERKERYLNNLKSKNSRSSSQLERLSLAAPKVLHIGTRS